MTLHLLLLVASALLSVGLYGALSQQSIVMVMMGLELMLNGIILAAGSLWWAVSPDRGDGQVLVLAAIAVMTLEMAMGFAVTVATYRAAQVDMTDDATALSG